MLGSKAHVRVFLHSFQSVVPQFSTSQEVLNQWLIEIRRHDGTAQPNASEKLLQRYVIPPEKIATRGHEHALEDAPRSFRERMNHVLAYADRVFECLYTERRVPDELIHVTCTGYQAPSAAQRFGSRATRPVRVTHAYHMGCAAAIPAIEIACAKLAKNPDVWVDVVHTESCTVHADPTRSNPERMVIESLFADGAVGYALTARPAGNDSKDYEVLGSLESLVPGTSALMSWDQSERGFEMTLARELPAKISEVVGSFVGRLLEKAGLTTRDLERAAWAIHPGGPAIIDRVQRALGLEDRQIGISRDVLRERGNISSATLPTIWERMLPTLEIGTPVVSLAFAPGLTLAGIVLRRV